MQKVGAPLRKGVPPPTIIAAVTYSPTTTKLQYHQHDMGLATGIGTVNRAFPHHYHHRKTIRQPPHTNVCGSGPRTVQRTRTPSCHLVKKSLMLFTHTPTLLGCVSDRRISTSQLHTSQCFHTRPINPVFSWAPLPTKGWKSHLGAGFPLRCFQRLSFPNVANQPCTWRYNWHTRGSSVPVLSY